MTVHLVAVVCQGPEVGMSLAGHADDKADARETVKRWLKRTWNGITEDSPLHLGENGALHSTTVGAYLAEGGGS